MSEWQPIETAPKEVNAWRPVDLWLHIYASPRSMGMSDSYRVTDCWRNTNGEWVHQYNGAEAALYEPYITHWMQRPDPPQPTTEADTTGVEPHTKLGSYTQSRKFV